MDFPANRYSRKTYGRSGDGHIRPGPGGFQVSPGNGRGKVEEIQLIIMATITPDTHCPAGANWLQAKLEAPQAVTFDVTAACSGFIFALNVAEQYIKAGTYQKVLVVASEIMTRTLNWKDRSYGHPLGRRGRGCFSFRKWRESPNPFHPHPYRWGQWNQFIDARRGFQDDAHLS